MAQASIQADGAHLEISRYERVGGRGGQVGVPPFIPGEVEAVRLGGVLHQWHQAADPGECWCAQGIGGLGGVHLLGGQGAEGGTGGE